MKPKFLLCLALLCSCSTQRFSQGHGDAGQFMIQHVVAYGGGVFATNGLPVMEGHWQYHQDQHDVVVQLHDEKYDTVKKFVESAFGGVGTLVGSSCPPILDFGVQIIVQTNRDYASVIIYRPCSMQGDKTAQNWEYMSVKRLDYPGLKNDAHSSLYAFPWKTQLDNYEKQGWIVDSVSFKEEGLASGHPVQAAIIVLKRAKN